MRDCQDTDCCCHRFHGKVAIMTGTASGIGWETALQFARGKARLAIGDVNEEGLAETRRTVEELGGECLALRVDVRSQEQVESFVSATLERFGTLHILVNNAGTGQFAPFAFMENEEYDRVRDINVRGMFHFCRAVLPTMMDNDYGKIVNITSIMSVMAGQAQSIYNAARARPRC